MAQANSVEPVTALKRNLERVTMISQAFRDRIVGKLLPTFCNDPSRGWGCEGFKEDWTKVSEKDAADFLSALDAGLSRT